MGGGTKRIAIYLAFGLAPYAICLFVNWEGNLATWLPGQRFGLLISTLFFLFIAAIIDAERR